MQRRVNEDFGYTVVVSEKKRKVVMHEENDSFVIDATALFISLALGGEVGKKKQQIKIHNLCSLPRGKFLSMTFFYSEWFRATDVLCRPPVSYG